MAGNQAYYNKSKRRDRRGAMNNEVLKKINRVYSNLCDEESKELFDAKFNYILNRDDKKFLEWVLQQNKDFFCPELDDYEIDNPNCEYILFGAGDLGKKTKMIMEKCNKKIVAWSDNNRNLWSEGGEGLPVVSPGRLKELYPDKAIIISATSKSDALSIYQQLLKMGFPRNKIVIPCRGFIMGVCGRQYFDVFTPGSEEVFVDAGCWDGGTSKQFVNWCNGHYNMIYAFEPDENCWERCENTFRQCNINKIEFIRKGTWNRSDILSFDGIGKGNSRIINSKECIQKVPVISIDEVLGDNKCSFIKMDVEGSEMETLIGAKEQIQKYKPKLAVSVYHKPEDLWELGDYILKLQPDYRLYLRHYTTCSYETVLYAL